MLRRRTMGNKKLVLFQKRFYPAGNYTWTVPPGCTEVDVFLVGAGGGASWISSGSTGGGGGGYTKTYKGKEYVKPSSGTWLGTYSDGRDGDAISVTPGQRINIIVGAGVKGKEGGYSQFLNSNYRANGGLNSNTWGTGGPGGSGGGGYSGYDYGTGGSDGSDGKIGGSPGKGQGHTTRDFGESSGGRNAAGGSPPYNSSKGISYPGASDYSQGTGGKYGGSGGYNNWYHGSGGGGYGGGAGAPTFDSDGSNPNDSVPGGDGTVLIRYYAYEE